MGSKKITVSLSEKTITLLEQIAEEKGLKKSAVVALAVAEYADRQKGGVHTDK